MSGEHRYRVGEPYIAGRVGWPERVEYNFRGGGHELRMFLPGLRAREVRAVRQEPAEFGLLVEGDVLLFLYRFGAAIPWGDAPYSWHLVGRHDPSEQILPPEPGSAEQRALLTIILVDADSGIIRALRALTLSPAFTRALHAAIREQAARPWPGDAAYDRQLGAVQARGTPAQLARLLHAHGGVRCFGGD